MFLDFQDVKHWRRHLSILLFAILTYSLPQIVFKHETRCYGSGEGIYILRTSIRGLLSLVTRSWGSINHAFRLLGTFKHIHQQLSIALFEVPTIGSLQTLTQTISRGLLCLVTRSWGSINHAFRLLGKFKHIHHQLSIALFEVPTIAFLQTIAQASSNVHFAFSTFSTLTYPYGHFSSIWN
mgnify:CR=1 FL=1